MTEETKTVVQEKTQADQEIESLQDFLRGIEGGTSCVIYRLEPSYAAGILEEIDIDEREKPIDVNYLIKKWGGRKLQLKFRNAQGRWIAHHKLSLKTHAPLLNGRPLDQSGNVDVPPKEVPSENKSASSSQLQSVMEIAQIMNAIKTNEITTFMELLKQQQQPVAPPVPQVDPIAQFGGFLTLFAQMQQLINPVREVPQEGSGQDEIFGMVSKLAELVRPAPQPSPPRLTAQSPAQNPSTNDKMDLPSQLAGLQPVEAVGTLQAAISKMPPEKAQETLAHIIGQIDGIGGREILLSALEQKGIIGEEYEEEDFLSDENEPQSQDGEGSGGAGGSNEGDGTQDR